mgnify:CR=1 FL=1
MSDFAAINEVYGQLLHGAIPGAGDRGQVARLPEATRASRSI